MPAKPDTIVLNPKLIYWLSTGLTAVVLLWSAIAYMFQASMIEGVRALGFPDFFRWQLAILKLLAVVLLLWPATPWVVKQWAYAGVGLFYVTALVAHTAHGDGIGMTILLLVFIALLVVSNTYLPK